MEAQSIQEYERLERYYWWFVGRRTIINRVLQTYFSQGSLRILDWGCGPGGNFKFLKTYGTVTGVDASEEALRACKEKGITNVVQAETLEEFHSDALFDLITNFDVLEHIENDRTYLRDVQRYLAPGGSVLVTVPAYQFLWTELDVVLGHKRRYTRKDLIRRFKDAGYEVVFASYFVTLLSPAFIAYRILERIVQPKKRAKVRSLNDSVLEFPRVLNWLFTKTLSLEALLLRWTSLPIGTSIILLARKSN